MELAPAWWLMIFISCQTEKKVAYLEFSFFYKNFPFTVAPLPHVKREDAFRFGKSEDVFSCLDTPPPVVVLLIQTHLQ